MINYKRMYETGVKLVNSENYVDSIPYFNTSMESSEFRLDSLIKLFGAYIKMSNFLKCREIIDKMRELTAVTLYEATVDYSEFNFHSSLQKFKEVFNKGIDQRNALFKIANLYANFGYLDVARTIYESLVMQDLNVRSSKAIISLDLLEKDYEHARKVLESIRYNILPKYYEDFLLFIDYFSGKRTCNSSIYLSNLLFDSSDKKLVQHIERHKEKRSKGIECFDKDLNVKELVMNVRGLLKRYNSVYDLNALTSKFVFPLDKDISDLKFNRLSGLQVNVLIGSDEIITMFPMNLSSEFNREGLLENQELLLRRGVR